MLRCLGTTLAGNNGGILKLSAEALSPLDRKLGLPTKHLSLPTLVNLELLLQMA